MDESTFSRVGKNIKCLRNVFGESQLDLGMAIGVSNTAISQYESGHRIPERDVLYKLAKHYRITESELVSINFDMVKKISKYSFDSPNEFNKRFLALFPIVTSEDAQKNKAFQSAYEMHNIIFDSICKGNEIDADKIGKCIDLYEIARNEGIPEAAANHLSWLMLTGFFTVILTPRLEEIFDVDEVNSLSIHEMLSGYLPTFDEDTAPSDFSSTKNRLEFLEDAEYEILADIFRLKRSQKYNDLGDYYLAFRHKYSLINNSLSEEMNNTVGNEMMVDLKILQNPYANAFFELCESIFL